MKNYEQKYKDAMARLELVTRTGLKLDPTYIFPELAESEDEKIRKEILDYIDKSTGCKRWVDWLKKRIEE